MACNSKDARDEAATFEVEIEIEVEAATGQTAWTVQSADPEWTDTGQDEDGVVGGEVPELAPDDLTIGVVAGNVITTQYSLTARQVER